MEGEEIRVFDSDTNELVLHTIVNTAQNMHEVIMNDNKMESSSNSECDVVIIDATDDVNIVNNDITDTEISDINSVKDDVTSVESDVINVKSDVRSFKSSENISVNDNVTSVKSDVASVKSDVTSVKSSNTADVKCNEDNDQSQTKIKTEEKSDTEIEATPQDKTEKCQPPNKLPHPAFGLHHLLMKGQQMEPTQRLFKTLYDNVLKESWESTYTNGLNYQTYDCNMCSVKFRYKFKLDEHMRIFHIPSMKAMNINASPKSFKALKKEPLSSSNDNMNHKQSFDKSVNETVVGKTSPREVKSASPETQPMTSQTGKASYSCTQCTMSFRHASRLHRHVKSVHIEKIHTAEPAEKRIHKCHFCPLVYMSRSTRYRHEKECHSKMMSSIIKHQSPESRSNDIKSDAIKTNVTKSDVIKRQPMDVQINDVIKHKPMNLNVNDIMNYQQFNLMYWQQFMKPKVPANYTYQFSGNFRREESPKSFEKLNPVAEVRKPERKSPPNACDDNAVPLDLSMKTGSPPLRMTGSKENINGGFNHFSPNFVPYVTQQRHQLFNSCFQLQNIS